jgi:TPP-dependent pyruvate/acetoin dehydrogenase alpha subunit
VAGSITDRASPFGIKSIFYEGTDVAEISRRSNELAAYVRDTGKPAWFHIRTVRLGPHSKGDDTRSAIEIDAARRKDPIDLFRPRIPVAGAIESRCRDIIERALEEAKKAPVACA